MLNRSALSHSVVVSVLVAMVTQFLLTTAAATPTAANSVAIANGIGNGINRSPGQSHGNPAHGIPTFSSVQELCQWLCQRQSPNYNYGCPPSCDGGVLDSWSKRAVRGRRFDDFSFGFDDYIFMKLLGRNLGDRA